MKTMFCAAQIASLLLLIASVIAAPVTHQYLDYSPSTYAGLLKDLKSILGFGQNINFDSSNHQSHSFLPSYSVGFSLQSGSQRRHNSYSDDSQFTRDTEGMHQTVTVLSEHFSSDTVDNPRFSGAHFGSKHKEDIAFENPEHGTPPQHSTGLLKPVPNKREVHFDTKVFPPASKAHEHKHNAVNNVNPKPAILFSEAAEERSTSTNWAPPQEKPKESFATGVLVTKAYHENSENEISHEDYAHAFLNGLAPSAGASKRLTQSTFSEPAKKC